VFVARSGISSESNVNSELKGVLPVSPGEIIEKIMHRGLGAMAVIYALIQTVKHIPFLLRVSNKRSALTSESPVESIHSSRARQCGVTDYEPFAVIGDRYFRRRSWQKRGTGVEQILQ
jgi:hypothetical protein